MSETAGGDAGAQASTGAANETNVTPSQTTNEKTAQGSGSTQGNTKEGAKPEAQSDNDFEEIKVGSVTGKVPKQIAAVIKNLERGFNSKAQEAASKEKLLSLARENPKEFYKQTGKDVYEFAEEVLAEKYELMNMDPRDRELRDLKAEKEERAKQETASKQEVLTALKEFGPLPEGAENATREQLIRYYQHQKQVHAQTQTSLDSELGNAFKESGLAPDRHLLAKVAFEMRSALAKNKSLSAKDAVAKVTSEYYTGAKQTFGKMNPKQIHEIFGDEFLESIRKYDLEQVNAQSSSRFGQQNKSPGQAPASENKTKKPMNEHEWRAFMEGR